MIAPKTDAELDEFAAWCLDASTPSDQLQDMIDGPETSLDRSEASNDEWFIGRLMTQVSEAEANDIVDGTQHVLINRTTLEVSRTVSTNAFIVINPNFTPETYTWGMKYRRINGMGMAYLRYNVGVILRVMAGDEEIPGILLAAYGRLVVLKAFGLKGTMLEYKSEVLKPDDMVALAAMRSQAAEWIDRFRDIRYDDESLAIVRQWLLQMSSSAYEDDIFDNWRMDLDRALSGFVSKVPSYGEVSSRLEVIWPFLESCRLIVTEGSGGLPVSILNGGSITPWMKNP